MERRDPTLELVPIELEEPEELAGQPFLPGGTYC